MSLPGKDVVLPSIGKRYLGTLLREARQAAGLSLEETGKQLEWGKTKVQRWETGQWSRNYITDLMALLTVYGITGEAERERFAQLMRTAKEQRGWWEKFPDVFEGAFPAFESQASQILTVEHTYVPGMLQTPEYTALVARAAGGTDEQVERRVQARAHRHAILERPTDQIPLLGFLVEEHAVARLAMMDEVGRAQIEHMAQMMGERFITFQVIPQSAGAHPVLGEKFAVMDFPADYDLSILYAEGGIHPEYVEDKAQIMRYRQMYTAACGVALSPKDTLDLLQGYLKNS